MHTALWRRPQVAAPVFAALLLFPGVQANASQTVWVSALDLTKIEQGAGKPGVDKTYDGKPISLGGQRFAHGIGTHAESVLYLNLNKQAERFSATVGIDDSTQDPQASIAFRVYGDGKMLWQSDLLKSGQAPAKVDVDVKGVGLLMLWVTDGGDGNTSDHAVWADAKLEIPDATPAGDMPQTTMRPREPEVILTPKPALTPRVNGPKVFGVRPGSPFLYAIPATGERPMTYSADGLPTGLHLDARTGHITGTLKIQGEYPVTLRAKNARGQSSRPFRIVVGDKIALTPPMGWNSWNSWATAVDQEKVLRSARAMVSSGLAQHGWTYINIDDAWQGARSGPLKALQANEKFPNMKGLCDEIHRLGLKAGIYSTPWVTSYARYAGGSAENAEGTWTKPVGAKTPNKKILPWAIGKYSFAAQDAKQWAEWGFDYLKYDWNPIEEPELKEINQALRNSGRDIVLSLSNSAPFETAALYPNLANAWRTAGDIRDNWARVSSLGFRQDKWAPYSGPGHWNDPDMLVVGYVGWGPKLHPTNLTPNEQYSHISLWALLASPLLTGCDLDRLDDFTLNLLTNDEVIDVDQDSLGKQAVRVYHQGSIDVFAKELEDGSRAVGFFNRGPFDANFSVNWSDLKLGKSQHVRDLWRQKDLGVSEKFDTAIPVHGVVLVRVTQAK